MEKEFKRLNLRPCTMYLGEDNRWVHYRGQIYQIWQTTKTKIYLVREYGTPLRVNPKDVEDSWG